MFFYQGQKCPVCSQTFEPQDDIVSCPVCGAPHHRACWQQEGHCHFAADHGTERQWQKQPPQPEEPAAADTAAGQSAICPQCGAANPEYAEFCFRCGRSLPGKDWQSEPQPTQAHSYTPFTMPMFDPLGGVAPKQAIEDSTAEQLQPLIGINSQYYLPRFAKMAATGRRTSWNWAGFLLPYSWLLYRKNIAAGATALLFFVSEKIAASLLLTRLLAGTDRFGSYAELYRAMLQAVQGPQVVYLYLMMAFALCSLAIRVLCGLFGNRIYMDTILAKARRQREDPEGFPPADSLRGGGISLLLGSLSYFIVWMIELFSNYL